MEQFIHTKEYGDHEILVGTDLRFYVPTDGDAVETFDSYAGACARIDKLEAVKSTRNKVKLALSVLDAEGNSSIITGLHASTLSFLGIKKQRRGYGNSNVFVQHSYVAAIIARVNRMKRDLDKEEGNLAEFKLLDPHCYSGVTPEKYAQAVQDLTFAHSKKLARAEEKSVVLSKETCALKGDHANLAEEPAK